MFVNCIRLLLNACLLRIPDVQYEAILIPSAVYTDIYIYVVYIYIYSIYRYTSSIPSSESYENNLNLFLKQYNVNLVCIHIPAEIIKGTAHHTKQL